MELRRAVSSVAARHKQWPTVGVRMEGLYRRACKWGKLDGLEGATSPLSAVLLLRSGAPDPHKQLGTRTFLHPVAITTATALAIPVAIAARLVLEGRYTRPGLSIPTTPGYGSLNLAQAVILLAYEWSKGVALASPPEVPLDPPAEHGEMEQLIQHFIRDLDAAGYFFPADRTEATLRTLRTALTKTGWSYNDIRMMHGIITILGRTPRPR